MSIYKYLRIKTAANWMSNADLPGRTLDDNDDLSKNIDKVYEEHKDDYDPVEDGPIYQDVNPIYQEPEKYGIPPEVAMAEREHYDNNKARWQKEYLLNLYNIRKRETDEALAAAVPGYSPTPPTAEEFVPEPIPYEDPSAPTPPGSHVSVGTLPDTPVGPIPYEDPAAEPEDELLGDDMFISGYKIMARATPEMQHQYEELMNTRNQIMMRLSVHNDVATQTRLNNARYRIERNLAGLINKARTGTYKY